MRLRQANVRKISDVQIATIEPSGHDRVRIKRNMPNQQLNRIFK
ncbi:hypothetical protein KHA80_07960 [Anaerobacillus sp. HL2]|nr:hypothetical protein KHA80_07960 [Anaerobacillus sp. HL2]